MLSIDPRHFKELFEILPDAVVLIDATTKLPVMFNQAAYKQLEYERSEFEKLSILDYEVQGLADSMQAHIDSTTKAQRDDFDTKHKTKYGKILDIRVTAISYVIEDKLYFLCTFRDITEQKSIEKELRKSENHLAIATNSANIGMWEYDVADDSLIWNDQMYKIYGIGKDKFLGAYEAWVSSLHPDDLKANTDFFTKALKDPSVTFDPEFRIIWPDDSIRHIKADSKVLRGEFGEPLQIIGVNSDVTNLKKVEWALRQNEEQFRVIFEKANCGIAYGNSDGRLILCNDYFSEMIGYSHQELKSMNFAEFTYAEDVSIELPLFEEIVLQKRDGYRLQKRYICKNSKIIWVDLAVSVVRDEDGHPLNYLGVVIDITNEKLLEDEIKQKERRFRDVTEASGEYIWELNALGEYIFISKPFEDMLGYSIEEGLGKTPFSFMPLDEQKRVGEYFLNEIVAKGSSFRGLTHRSVAKDGSEVWQKVNGLPMLDKSGAVIGYRGAALDITAEKTAQEELEASKARAEAASRAKTEFLANMSHEIRTPMNAVIGLGGILDDMIDEPSQKDILHKINSSSRMLLGVINDILDYSKIEAGKLELEYNRFHIEDVLSQLKVLFVEKASQKGLELYFYTNAQNIGLILGDELRLTQVLTNLLSNAIKFTHEGSITLSIELLESLKNKKVTLGFSVEDSGIGIDEEQLKRLFQPFSQADSSTTRKYGGTGLGLAISKNIIVAMGSDIKIESKLGVGTKFSFVLDFELVSCDVNKDMLETKHIEALNASLVNTRSTSELVGLNILVVEDNELNQDVISLLLKKVGISYEIASNGEDGYGKFIKNQDKYDLILMDLQMPIMSGYEATKKIREHNTKIPIVALTAAAMSEDKEKVFQVGMNEHISKPIDRDVLYRVISDLCSVKLDYIRTKKASKDVLDREYLAQILDGQNHINSLLIKFKKHLTEGDFKDIVQVVSEDIPEAHKQVHTLKGVSGNIGAFELCDILTLIDAKYKRNEKADKNDVDKLLSAKANLLAELDSAQEQEANSTDFKKLSCIELNVLFQEVLTKLEEGEFIEEDVIQTLYRNLTVFIDKDELNRWKVFVEDFEFDEAHELMIGWRKEVCL